MESFKASDLEETVIHTIGSNHLRISRSAWLEVALSYATSGFEQF